MHPPLKFSGIRRSITAIACTAAIVISAGCGDSSSPKLGNSSPNQTLQTASVEPTPEETAADQRARALLAQMTLDEKVDMMHGESNNSYGFHNAPIPRLGIPALTMADGPMGVRIAHPDVNGQRATQLPSGLALAATWDTSLAEQYGKLMGEEAHSTGHNIMLGPVLDIARIAQFGRVFEKNYGEDPLLSGMVGAANIRGIRTSPVTTSVKHYNLNFQETNRLFGNNSIVDQRTLQEIHTRPYAIAVRDARPGAIMCAFNKVNGAFSCESELILNEILKTRLDFQGWVLTDYFASFSTVPAALAGLDQEMPGSTGGEPATNPSGPATGTCRFCDPLLNAVRAGQVPQSRIDDAVLRILRMMYLHGLFDTPPVIEPLPEAENGATSRTIAEQAMVLLKNEGNALPLDDRIASIAVIGTDADTVVAGGSSGLVIPTYSVSPLEGIRSRAGAGATVQHIRGYDPVSSVAFLPGPDPVPSDFLTPAGGQGRGLRAEYFLNQDFSGTPEIDRTDPYAGINGGFFLFQGFIAASPHFPEQPRSMNSNSSIRWTGTLTAPVAGSNQLALTSTGTSRLFVDGNEVGTTTPIESVTTPPRTNTVALNFEAGSVHDVRIEFVNDAPTATDTGPQFKFGWTPPAGVVAPQAQAAADLVRTADVAVVVVRDFGSEGGDKPHLRLPNGQGELIRQVATANPNTIVVMTVAGDVSPSGKLPVTMPVDDTKTPISTLEQFPGTVSQDVADQQDQQLTEGIFVGYRGYEQFNIQPQYPFGHGLSYTTFAYSNLRTTPTSVTVNVTNSGEVAGSEIVPVYAGKLPTPLPTAPKSLAGFAKVALQPGQSHDVTIALAPESLSYWDVTTHAWVAPAGNIPIMVGASSADIRLNGTVQTAATTPAAPAPAATAALATSAPLATTGPRGVGGFMKLLSTSFPSLKACAPLLVNASNRCSQS
jgi:beta-glucosidase